ncbi:NAD(P)H-dependent quinone reductase [Staphylococcus aureus]|nr:NAD(P)H-dependent quinone reductase [Staphylococcus aureus]
MTDILANKGILDTEQFGLSVMVAFGYRQQDPPKNKTRQAYEDVIEWVGPKE